MKISVDLVANTGTFNTDIQRSTRALEREMRKAEIETKRRAEGIRSAITNIAVSFVAPIAGAIFGGAFVRLADQFENVTARLRLATKSASEYARAQDELFSSAQRTSSAFADTVDLYSRLAISTQSLGISQDRLLAITETVNQAIQLSGSTAESAQAAVIQFGQGLASGQLRGEELNSVLEQTPRLALALAQGLGVPLGQLRALATQGKITSEAIVSALENQAGSLKTEFGQIPITVGRALTQLNNSLLQTVGEINQANGITRDFALLLSSVAQSIESGGLRIAIDGVAASVGFLIRNLDTLSVYLASRLVFTAVVAGITAFASATTIAAAAVAGLNAALAIVGGPVGLLALVASAVYYFATSENDAEKATRALEQAQKSINGQSDQTQQAALDNARAIREETLARLESLRAAAKQSPFIQGVGNKSERDAVTAQLDALDYQITELELRMAGEFQPAVKAAQSGIANFGTATIKAAKESLTLDDSIRDAVKTLGDLDSDLRNQIATLGMSEDATIAYRLSVGDLSDEVAKAGPLGAEYAKSIIEQTANLRGAKEAQDAFNRSVENQKALAKDRGEFGRAFADIGVGPKQRRFNQGLAQVTQDPTDLNPAAPDYQQQLADLREYNKAAVAQYSDQFDKIEARSADFGLQLNDSFLTYADNFRNLGTELGNTLVGALESATAATANLAAQTLLWGGSALEAVKSIARTLLTDVVAGFIQAGIKAVAFATIQRAQIALTAAASNTAQVATAATTVATQGTIAAAAAPAAALTSLSSFGVNSGFAIAGIALVAGAIGALVSGAFADGGLVSGPGSGRSDSILAKVSNGEFVMTAAAVNKFGPEFFDALNSGQMPAFADGGIVGMPIVPRSVSNIGGGQKVNVNIINRFEGARFTQGDVRQEADGSLTIEGVIDQMNDTGSQFRSSLLRATGLRNGGLIG